MSLRLIKSELLRLPHIQHGMTTRHGGASNPPYDSLNLGLHVGDDQAHVIENRTRACQGLGFSLSDWVSGEQVHGNRVATVQASDKGNGALLHSTAIPGVDGLVTDEPGVLLSGYFADCIPLFLVDLDGPRIALGHAGWRGTVANIAGQLVKTMVTVFGTKVDSLLIWIGPGIGPCCFSVSTDVSEQFAEKFGDEHIVDRSARQYIDLRRLNRHLFIESGVRSERIATDASCTACETSRFFSHRAEGPKTGRMAALIGIRGQ